MWINTLLRTYAWISLLSDNGLINNFLQLIGLTPKELMYTDFAVVLGLISDILPFMVIPIHTSIRKIDPSLIEASHDLGANSFQTFVHVILKMSIPGVINGVMMTFLLSISTFVIPKLLGGGQYMLIGNLIENQFISVGNWNFGSSISIILTVIILIGLSVMKRFDREEKEERDER
jgi:spermidine/putrescine transport system permease protein